MHHLHFLPRLFSLREPDLISVSFFHVNDVDKWKIIKVNTALSHTTNVIILKSNVS